MDFSSKHIVGLTGMSGAGKSTAAALFAKRGFHVIDCDTVARDVIARSPCRDEVNGKFPEFFAGGVFDRKKAAAKLFTDPKKLEQYQGIVFPYVVYTIARMMNDSAGRNILLDAPTLFQSGADDFCDGVIAVVAARDVCVRRITERDNISAESALMRLDNQQDEEFFRQNADIIIENNKSMDEFIDALKKHLEKQWQKEGK